jgi:CheY-like chemotaxis protein
MPKILVVDDEPEIVNILEAFLTKMGYEVLTALGGEKAIEIINSQAEIDLMILDSRMPRVRGIDVLREMRRINRDIPFIVLTGSMGMQRDIDKLKEVGYNKVDTLYKPVDLFQLLEMIKKKLCGRKF